MGKRRARARPAASDTITASGEMRRERGFASSLEADSDDHSHTSSDHDTSFNRKSRKRPKLVHKSDKNARSRKREANFNGHTLTHSRSSHEISSPSSIRFALLQWYAGVHATRGMPWRKPYQPSQGVEERAQRAYEVWVSEVMLQQTQVVTVIPYYNRWMQQYPTINDLARSTIDEVNALWKGLGYYSRASRLLAGAQKVVKDYSGRLPDNAKDMEANIPGIGRYSAGAICSIAYGERVPVLDGNVHRLLSRFLALHAPPKTKATLDVLWAAATKLVQSETHPSEPEPNGTDVDKISMEVTQYPGDINQALIELGSTVCKVREPDCKTCPLRNWCRAYTASELDSQERKDVPDIEDICQLCEPLLEDGGGVTTYPMKVERKKVREELDAVNVIEWRSSPKADDRWFLMVRRPEGGKYPCTCLLAGLYEFPTSTNIPKATPQATLVKSCNELLADLLLPLVLPYDGRRQRGIDEDALQITEWVVLGGGGILPALRPPGPLEKHGSLKNLNLENSADDEDDEASPPSLPTGAMWIKLKDVPNTNMGTGVVKVWSATKDLWERELSRV